MPAGSVLHRWSAEGGGENPYLGLLALADRFVVTSDSISMLVEVASLRRPLAIFDLPVGGSLYGPWARRPGPRTAAGRHSAISCIGRAFSAMAATSARSAVA